MVTLIGFLLSLALVEIFVHLEGIVKVFELLTVLDFIENLFFALPEEPLSQSLKYLIALNLEDRVNSIVLIVRLDCKIWLSSN